MSTIASRVRQAVRASGRTQADIAASVEMKTDAFSRALNGQRGFGALELADLARELGVDIHFLITGEEDPSRLVLAARHDFDQTTRARTAAGAEDDERALADVQLAYQQAGAVEASPELPRSPDELRTQLGKGFVRPFIERIEQLGVDVVRMDGLHRAWSFTLEGRHLIALPPAHGNWFFENWSLAHELGHLSLGHRGVTPGLASIDRAEPEANAFAADLLLPEAELRRHDWSSMTPHDLAALVWDLGVSTQALRNRLESLALSLPQDLTDVLDGSTPRLLRRHGDLRTDPGLPDPITARMKAATQRHFPAWLVEAHLDAIAAGRLHKGTVAWMLGVDADQLEVEEPEPSPTPSSDALLSLLS